MVGKILLLLELVIRSLLPPFYSFSHIEEVCKKKQKKNPKDPYVMWFLGIFYLLHRKYLESQTQLESLMKIREDSKEVNKLLSQVYFKTEQYEKVVEILGSPEILSGNDKENYYLGMSLFELGNYDKAINYLTNYVKYHPKDYVSFVKLGYSYFMVKLYDQALYAYRQAERLNPSRNEIKDSIDLCIEKVNERHLSNGETHPHVH